MRPTSIHLAIMPNVAGAATRVCLLCLLALLCSCSAQARTTFTYTTNVGGPILDNTATTSTITVADTFTIQQFQSVTIHGLQHTFVGDLLVTLAHNGVVVDVFDAVSAESKLTGDYVFVPSGGADFLQASQDADGDIVPSSSAYNTLPDGSQAV